MSLLYQKLNGINCLNAGKNDGVHTYLLIISQSRLDSCDPVGCLSLSDHGS